MSKQSPPSDTRRAAPQRHLSLFDSTNIIVGIIIGATIYESTPDIAAGVPLHVSLGGWEIAIPGVVGLIAVWLLGGFLSLVGAICYAELAAANPKQGGDFVYLSRAFGRPIGFLFGWAQLWVVRPGSIGAMAFVFAKYANQLVPLPFPEKMLLGSTEIAGSQLALLTYAVGSVVVLSAINIFGVQMGKWTQNLLTTAKVLGLVLVAAVGLYVAGPEAPVAATAVGAAAWPPYASFGLTMILVLFAYGGWNEMAYVGAEVRDPTKNILRAMLLGTVAVAAIYIAVTLAFVHTLGFEGTVHSKAVAADVLGLGFGDFGRKFISLLISVSALGAINGQIFTGARIYYAMGSEHRLFALLGRWHPRLGTPVWSLLIQAAITLAIIFGFGRSSGGFKAMVIFTTPVFWLFLVMVAQATFVLRQFEPNAPRPYKMPLFPAPAIIFAMSSFYMAYTGIAYAIGNSSSEAFWSIGLLLVGMVLCLFDRKPDAAETT
jgi:APA family basic amino acid/polyamine antiporter